MQDTSDVDYIAATLYLAQRILDTEADYPERDAGSSTARARLFQLRDDHADRFTQAMKTPEELDELNLCLEEMFYQSINCSEENKIRSMIIEAQNYGMENHNNTYLQCESLPSLLDIWPLIVAGSIFLNASISGGASKAPGDNGWHRSFSFTFSFNGSEVSKKLVELIKIYTDNPEVMTNLMDALKLSSLRSNRESTSADEHSVASDGDDL